MIRREYLLTAASSLLSSCNYKMTGKTDLIPKHIETIGIPPFGNDSVRYKLTEQLPNFITREFHARTRFRILPDAHDADAILRGRLATITVVPINAIAGIARTVQVQVAISISLIESANQKHLFDNPGFTFTQAYEVSTDSSVLFDESTPAFDRLARDASRSIVTAILENF